MGEPTVVIHERVLIRHPRLTEESVREAWRNRICCQVRVGLWPPQYVAVGFDGSGRQIEMVAIYDPERGEVLIFYANTPVSEAVRRELGLERR